MIASTFLGLNQREAQQVKNHPQGKYVSLDGSQQSGHKEASELAKRHSFWLPHFAHGVGSVVF